MVSAHRFAAERRAGKIGIRARWVVRSIAVKKRRRRVSTQELETIPAPPPTPIELWRWFDPDDLSGTVPLLPSPFAEVFRLYWQENLRVSEIAAQLQIPSATVMARLFRGTARLRKLLRERLPPKIKDERG
jgi:DNA-directed RNA polymerase specialized sigma24 family protein